MSRTSNNEYRNGLLFNGYDYTNQAWVVEGAYVACGHTLPNPLTGKATPCKCYGKIHAGEPCIEPSPNHGNRTEYGSRDIALEIAEGLNTQTSSFEERAKKDRKNKARRERDQAMRDMGLVKVRGALGGTYWE